MKKIQYWQFIPMEKRMQLRKDFGIKPSNPMQIENNKIVIDGISEGDLANISIEILQEASGKVIHDIEPKGEDIKKEEEKEEEEAATEVIINKKKNEEVEGKTDK